MILKELYVQLQSEAKLTRLSPERINNRPPNSEQAQTKPPLKFAQYNLHH